MKYVGMCDDISFRSRWGEASKYLLWEFESDKQCREIADYQMNKRIYLDEFMEELSENT